MQSILITGIVLGVLFVNGWTDAPNSIAAAVASRALSFRRAAGLAALCELTGVMVSSLLVPTVAETVFSMVDLGRDPSSALIALQAALLAVICWATAAWYFGIPTSESHALLAGLTGSAFALHGNFSGVSAAAWGKILFGLIFSTLLGALFGRQAARWVSTLTPPPQAVRRGQICCAGTMAFLHGAQDGQKFLAILLLLRSLAEGQTAHMFRVSLPLAALCAGIMSLGVLCGGRRIIDTVTVGMAGLRPVQSLAADSAGAICLLAASLLGLPVSTTHTKVSALLGASTLKRQQISFLPILGGWLLTFPGCGLLAFLLTRLML